MNKNRLASIFTLILVFFLLSVRSWAGTANGNTSNSKLNDIITESIAESINPVDANGQFQINAPFSPKITIKTITGVTTTADIDRILKHLGYPQKKWPAIEKEVIDLLKKIDFPHLKREAMKAKSNPLKLKEFITKLGGLFEQDGYIDNHPLTKLLATSYVDDNLSQEILTSSIAFGQKLDSIEALSACTAISQLGSIILNLLDINVKIAFSPAHVFNCIPLDGKKVLFIDFSNQIFELVNFDKYYLNLGERTELLKDQYHISPARLAEIKSQIPSEYQSDSLQELLSFLYLYVYISDDYSTTPAIYLNLGNIYASKGKFDKAILYYNQAISMNPDYADAYHGRGLTFANEGNFNQAISDISKAIELFPEFAEAYDDRGKINSSMGDNDNAMNDYNQAIIIDPNYTQSYLDRGIIYSNKGNIDRAITDYSKAIEIDSYFTDAYKFRAEAYFSKKEYDKSWQDVHKVEDSGDQVNPDLMEKLKNVSDSKRLSMILIGAPVLIVLFFFFFK